MQEWLTVIIVLLIVAVVLDGVRRMRQSRRSALRMSRNVSQQSTAAVGDIKDYGSELPSGGARVVNVRKAQDAVERNEQIRQSAQQKRRSQLKSFRIPEQVSLNLDQQVPTLMESVADTTEKRTSASPRSYEGLSHSYEKGTYQKGTYQKGPYQKDTYATNTDETSTDEVNEYNPDANETDAYDTDAYGADTSRTHTSRTGHDDIADFNDDDRIEPVFSAGTVDSDDAEDPDEWDLDEWDKASFSDGSDEALTQARVKTPETQTPGYEAPPNQPTKAQSSTEQSTKAQSSTAQPSKPGGMKAALQNPFSKKPEPPPKADLLEEEEEQYREPELVLVINVMAHKGEQFPGDELLDIILDQGLRFGAMNIFHRHEDDDGDGEILYSMANIVVPGTFDLAKMPTFATPGVSLFMTLPMDANSIDAFEDMLTTAKIIAARLNGELKDENRSVLTPQIITHYRSKLQEFVRKQLSKAPA